MSDPRLEEDRAARGGNLRLRLHGSYGISETTKMIAQSLARGRNVAGLLPARRPSDLPAQSQATKTVRGPFAGVDADAESGRAPHRTRMPSPTARQKTEAETRTSIVRARTG